MVRTLRQQYSAINSCIQWWWDNWVKPEDLSPFNAGGLQSYWSDLDNTCKLKIPHLEMIHWAYRYGESRKWWYGLSYPYFEQCVVNKSKLYDIKQPKIHHNKFGLFWTYLRERHVYSTKYQKKEGHGKREGVEEKELWREVSGKNRDYRKSKDKRGPGRCWKNRSATEHRAFVRQNIHRENWDVFSDQEYKQCIDPRWWD